ncbi:MAG: hypothetical protein AABY22_26995 [Nanoarchaeota archaeon]
MNHTEKNQKVKLKFTISHKDPKIEKQGVKAVKGMIKAIGKLLGEDIKIYNE